MSKKNIPFLRRCLRKLLKITSPLYSDVFFLKAQYYAFFGKRLDLKNPKTFNEKIQWLKLYNRRPEYTTMVDKYAAKKYVADIIGEEYIIPTLGVYDKAEDIDFDSLPDQFVLKVTHDSGGIVVCKNKKVLNIEQTKKKLKNALRREFFSITREYPYKDVPRRIIAEQYMEDSIRPTASLADYKFFCFDGEPKYCQVIQDRNTKEMIDFFDMEWAHQEFVGLIPAALCPQKSKCFEVMKQIARDLSKGNSFSRIDLYEVNEKTYFGEITFFPVSGMGVFKPEKYNEILGKMINLNGIGGGKFKIKINQESGSYESEYVDSELRDYKFFCFEGEVKIFKVDFDRFTDHRANYYNKDGQLLYFGEVDCPPDYNRIINLPINLTHMIVLAEKLAKGFPFLRVDFYSIKGQTYFGELTFFPASGLGKFTSDEWDYKLGSWINIPQNN